MSACAIQMAAHGGVEQAEAEVRLATIRVDALVAAASLRELAARATRRGTWSQESTDAGGAPCPVHADTDRTFVLGAPPSSAGRVR